MLKGVWAKLKNSKFWFVGLCSSRIQKHMRRQALLDRTVAIVDEICSSLSSLLDNVQNNNNNNKNLAKIIPYEIDGFGNAYYMV